MNIAVINGDLLKAPVDVIVNPWNRNRIPYWLLLPHGVSGAIKKQAGMQPFRELAQVGSIPLGEAVVTSSGRLPFKAIIHVASIDVFWHSSPEIIHASVKNAMIVAAKIHGQSIAFPLLGAGSGRISAKKAEETMLAAFAEIDSPISALVIRYRVN